ncbi:MAG: alkaline phosphatase PhoX [Solirubrobacteraceae bacterium]
MRRRTHTVAIAAAAVAALGGTAIAATPDGTSRGPSTNKNPYVIPVADGVSTTSILSVGDGKTADNGYRMVGIPDGLGARKSSRGTFELFMNQELGGTLGIPRRHGQPGAFVSNYQIDRESLRVRSGRDLINPPGGESGLRYWDYVTQTYRATPSSGGPNPRHPGDTFEPQNAPFSRFCSGTLSKEGQLYNRRSGRGYDGQLYFANEENGNPGRLFGVTTDGEAQQLPRLGLFSWENTKPAYNETDRTLAIGQEDGSAGQSWIYSGVKSKKGNAFQRAGLTNGVNSVLDLVDESVSTDAGFRAKYGKNKPADFDLSEVDWDQSAQRQNDEAAAEGLTLNRPEDGSWDPNNPNDYYFLTTEGGDKTPDGNDPPNTSRDGGGLWRMRFEDIEHPELGGTLTLLLDGSEEPKLNKPDNMDIDRNGNLLIQEDPGGNAHIARIVAYRIADGARGVLAQFDPAIFSATPSNPQPEATIDEESSGIIDAADILGKNTYLFDAQVHKSTGDPETVEYGQLLAMRVKSFDAVYGGKLKADHGDDEDDGHGGDRG